MEFVIQAALIILSVLGIAATIFGVVQGVEWLLAKLGRKEPKLGGKGRVVRRDKLATLDSSDASRFVRDIEFVDGTVVAPNARFRKRWEIQNVGSVTWQGRNLQRVGAPEGPGLIKSPVRVPIPTTRPGDVVQLTVELVAPSTEGTSTARFKMADKHGNLCFPDRYREGLFVTVNVVEESEAKKDTEALPAVSVTERVEGTWALLDVRNVGQRAGRFRATAQIVQGTEQPEEPYSARWRETYERDVQINAGDLHVLNVAEALPGSFEAGDVLRYRSFRFCTAQLPIGRGEFSESFDRRQMSDEGIVIHVSITCDPPLREPFNERYRLCEGRDRGWQELHITQRGAEQLSQPNALIQFTRLDTTQQAR